MFKISDPDHTICLVYVMNDLIVKALTETAHLWLSYMYTGLESLGKTFMTRIFHWIEDDFSFNGRTTAYVVYTVLI